MEITRLTPKHLNQMQKLFALIAEDPAAKKFHPHPFDDDNAQKISNYSGQDIYLGLLENNELIGYGMLRGWDANYKIPSLGIYLAPSARGRGLSLKLMAELHHRAYEMRSPSVRLKVYPDNIVAINLYKRMGYLFTAEEDGQLVGYFELSPTEITK